MNKEYFEKITQDFVEWSRGNWKISHPDIQSIKLDTKTVQRHGAESIAGWFIRRFKQSI